MFRAHRGVNRHRPLIHRGARRASVKVHAKRALRLRHIKGLRYARPSRAIQVRQARYKSLIRVPASYNRRRPVPYKPAGPRVPASYRRRKTRYPRVHG